MAHALLFEVACERDQHEAVEHRHAEEGDEADARGDREGDIPEPERKDTAEDGKGDGEEDQERRADLLEGQPEQEEDQAQRQRTTTARRLRAAAKCSNWPPHSTR